MALWGLNDNLASPGTVTMSWTKETGTGVACSTNHYTITGSGTSFGYTGCGEVGDVIRLGVKGGEGEYGDYFGDAVIVCVASSESISVADTGNILNVAIAATDYHISQLPKFTTQDGRWNENNTAEPALHVHATTNAFDNMALPGIADSGAGSKNVPVYIGGSPGVPGGLDVQVGDTFLNDGNDIPVAGVGTVVVVASQFNTGSAGVTVIGIDTGYYVDYLPLGGAGATLQNGNANIPISAIGSSTLTVSAATGTGISAADVLVINTSYGISLASTMTAAITTGETLKFKRVQAGVDAFVYGIGQTVGAGQSMAPVGGYTNSDGNFVPGGIPYTTQGGGWVGVTTYMDCQGNLRVKSEVLVATSSNAGVTTNAGDGYAKLDYMGTTVGAGINTGSDGILYPTNLGGTV